MRNYALSPCTVFGMWNITEETELYTIEVFSCSNTKIAPPFPPSSFNFLGWDNDALSGNIGWYHMTLNKSTGKLSTSQFKSSGIDCDAAFWDNIPPTACKIVVTGRLGPSDGVGFYFAELEPCCEMTCPTNLTVATCCGNAVVNYPSPTVTGSCGPDVTIVCSPPSGSTFPLGTTTVTCTATDGNGLQVGSCSFTVTVVQLPPDRCNQVALDIDRSGTNIVLSWPDYAHCYIVEETGELLTPSSTVWTTVTNSPTYAEGTYQVTLPANKPRRFYRLKQTTH